MSPQGGRACSISAHLSPISRSRSAAPSRPLSLSFLFLPLFLLSFVLSSPPQFSHLLFLPPAVVVFGRRAPQLRLNEMCWHRPSPLRSRLTSFGSSEWPLSCRGPNLSFFPPFNNLSHPHPVFPSLPLLVRVDPRSVPPTFPHRSLLLLVAQPLTTFETIPSWKSDGSLYPSPPAVRAVECREHCSAATRALSFSFSLLPLPSSSPCLAQLREM